MVAKVAFAAFKEQEEASSRRKRCAFCSCPLREEALDHIKKGETVMRISRWLQANNHKVSYESIRQHFNRGHEAK